MHFAKILVWTALLSPLPCSAATYYVSNAGSDANSGTELAPWATISKLNHTRLLPGDVVLFARGGTWPEQITVQQSGVAGAPITYAAYGSGPTPVITGSNVRGAGISIPWHNYITIEQLAFTAAKEGIFLSNANNITVVECETYNNSDRGISVAGTSSSHLVVINNHIYNNVNDGFADFAMGDFILVQGNTVNDNVTSTLQFGAGIRVVGFSDSLRPTNVRIIDNTVYHNGIGSGGSKYATGNGIHMDTIGDGLLVYGNRSYNNQQFGIQVEWSGTKGSHHIINNTTYGNQSMGLVIYRRSWNVVATGNVSYGNLENCVIWGEYGEIDPVGMHNNTFTNNWCYSPIPGGISFSAAWGANNDGVKGSGNIYQNNCLGLDGANHFQYGNKYLATANSLVTTAVGAVSTNCSTAETAAELH